MARWPTATSWPPAPTAWLESPTRESESAADNRIGQTPFQLRFDFPLYISRPALALDRPAAPPFAFRWSFSFKPAF